MNRLNRYILAQLFGPFGFFALVLAGILWLAMTLNLIDRVIANGQSALVFLQMSSLVMPRVLTMALPIAAFAATLYAINRLFSEAELVVIMTSGKSPLYIAKSVIAFGGMVMVFMYLITLYLMPTSQTILRNQLDQMSRELAATLINEGQFLHPDSGVTLYIRDATRAGQMKNVFIHDERDPDNVATYSAKEAVLVITPRESRLLMVEGVLQRLDAESRLLHTVQFDRLTNDLTDLIPPPDSLNKIPYDMNIAELFDVELQDQYASKYTRDLFMAEAHEKLTQPLGALALPLIALASLLSGGYQRTGYTARVLVAIALGILAQVGSSTAKPIITNDASWWFLAYLPPITAIVLSLLILARTGYTSRRSSEMLPA